MSPALPTDMSDEEIETRLGERYYGGSQAREEQLTDEITAVIRQFIKRRFDEGRRPALRDAHAQDTGCAKAIFRVDQKVPCKFRHGVLKVPGREFEAWIRFSNANSERLNSRVPDARGMAIKLLGVDGPKLLEDEGKTQDFIMANSPVFFVDDLLRYKETLISFHSGGYFRQLLSVMHLRPRELLTALRVDLTLTTNPLFCQYWSKTPYRLGQRDAGVAIKFTAKPRAGITPPFRTSFLTYLSSGFSLKQQMANALSSKEVWFDFFIQCHVDDRTPVEDTSVEWKESVSPLVHVAKIIIPAQDILSVNRDRLCEDLSFNPWHCLSEHKPLGALNRARKSIYLEISKYRRQLNCRPLLEPANEIMEE
jgi:hypothetical protein